MEENKVIVYVKTDEQNRILEVGSSVFLTDTEGWIKIDDGLGDKYTHAQRGYFEKPVLTNDGVPRYKLSDGKPVERTQEEIEADKPIPSTATPTIEQLAKETSFLKEQIESIFEVLTTLARNI